MKSWDKPEAKKSSTRPSTKEARLKRLGKLRDPKAIEKKKPSRVGTPTFKKK